MLYFCGVKVTPEPFLNLNMLLETILFRWNTLSNVFSPGFRVIVVLSSVP